MTSEPRTAAVITFGCKINQVEGEALERALARLGYARADRGDGFDLVVVNTCTVTARADGKARQLIRRLHRRHPRADIYVTGCAAVRQAHVFRVLPGVRDVLADKDELLERLARAGHVAALETGRPDFHPSDGRGLGNPRPPSAPRPSPGESPDEAASASREHRTRAFVKVQDGCDAFCAYCIVPHVRPRLWSKPSGEVLDEVRALIHAGHKEVVLAGIHLGKYGIDRPRAPRLAGLVRDLLELPGLLRLRLSSIEMPEVDPELLDLMATRPNFCPHLHLPLQSGDDAVLNAMNRRYTASAFLRAVERIRSRIPDLSLTTDVIAGFPGETDEAFLNTMRVCREAAFSKLHVFPFSVREGTAAATMAGRLSPGVIARRKRRLLVLADELALAYKQRFISQTVEVLVETREESPAPPGGEVRGEAGLFCGLTPHYMRVRFTQSTGRDGGTEQSVPDHGPRGEIVRVRVTSARAEFLEGEAIVAG